MSAKKNAAKAYRYAKLEKLSREHVLITRLNGHEPPQRTGTVWKIAPGHYRAARHFGSCLKRDFKTGPAFCVDEPKLFGEAARWAVGGFDSWAHR